MTQRLVNMTPEQLYQRMLTDRPATLVDIRSTAEYRAGGNTGQTPA